MRLLLLTCAVLLSTSASAQIEAQREGALKEATLTSPGSPNATYRLTGTRITATSISGRKANISYRTDGAAFVMPPMLSHPILSSIGFAEESDDPCFLQLGFWSAPYGFAPLTYQSADSPEAPQFAKGSFMKCGGGRSLAEVVWSDYQNGMEGSFGVDIPDLPLRDVLDDLETAEAAFPPGTPVGTKGAAAIHGLQVCSNDRDEAHYKIKGIKVLVTRMNEDGTGRLVRSGSYATSFERPNCRAWEQVRRCPLGQIAVGVEAHLRREGEFGSRETLTGLALLCRAVTVTPL